MSPAPLFGCGDGDTSAQTDLSDGAISDGGATHTDAGPEDAAGGPLEDVTDPDGAPSGSDGAGGDENILTKLD